MPTVARTVKRGNPYQHEWRRSHTDKWQPLEALYALSSAKREATIKVLKEHPEFVRVRLA